MHANPEISFGRGWRESGVQDRDAVSAAVGLIQFGLEQRGEVGLKLAEVGTQVQDEALAIGTWLYGRTRYVTGECYHERLAVQIHRQRNRRDVKGKLHGGTGRGQKRKAECDRRRQNRFERQGPMGTQRVMTSCGPRLVSCLYHVSRFKMLPRKNGLFVSGFVVNPAKAPDDRADSRDDSPANFFPKGAKASYCSMTPSPPGC